MAPVVQSCPSKSYMMTYTKLHMSKETEMILGGCFINSDFQDQH